MIMNKLPNLSFHLQSCGLSQKVELDLAVFLPRLQKLCGIDLKPVVIPLLVKFVRSRIKDLELTREDESELKNLQEQEQNLVSC
jgi:hypothetical protein